MALLFMDGFDKYGGANSNSTIVQGLLTAEWTSVASGSAAIVAGLSATGFAFQVGTNGTANKTLATNYARLIGGVRFNTNLAGASAIQLIDSATVQASIVINNAGTIAVRNGSYSIGTILGTSTVSVTANSTHYLEWDITFSNAGSYQLWLDGVSILSGSGDTTSTANNYANLMQLIQSAIGVVTFDDFYLFDTTGSTNNAPLLTSPRIETTFPSSDGAVQFAIGASTLGNSISRGSTNYAGSANTLYVRAYTPTRNCTLNSILLLPVQTNATVNLRPVVYADNAGTPNGGALLSAGSTLTGQIGGTLLTMPLTTPQSLTAGTQYWLGFMQDAGSANMSPADNLVAGRNVTATFASGAPSTCPATAGGQQTVVVYGNITLASPVNWYEVASQPPQGAASYVYDSVVGHEDLYAVPNLSAPATSIYAVAVKANVAKSDAGARTISVRCKSGTTDSAGSGGTAIAPATSYTWVTSLYPTDPNTGAAWTLSGVNAVQCGLRIET